MFPHLPVHVHCFDAIDRFLRHFDQSDGVIRGWGLDDAEFLLCPLNSSRLVSRVNTNEFARLRRVATCTEENDEKEKDEW